MNGRLRTPTDFLFESLSVDLGASHGLDDFHGPLAIVEEIVVGAEEPSNPILLLEPAHFVNDARAAL